MVAQRTRILLGNRISGTPSDSHWNSQIFGPLWLIGGRITIPILSIIWIFFNSILIWCRRIFWEQGAQASLKSAGLVMDFGEGRLVAGHRFGSFTPSFDGVQLTLGGDKSSDWGLRAFVTQPVQRHTVSPDWTSPISYFSGAAIFSRHVPWANGKLYFFQLNEGSILQKRNLSTMGFRGFAKHAKEQFDYEIESFYQVGEVDHTNHLAHRHHGEVVLVLRPNGPYDSFICLTIRPEVRIRKRILISCSQNAAQNMAQLEFWESSFH